MRASLMLYGANGYSGRLIARALVNRGVRPLLAGRSAEKLEGVASELGLDCRVAPLEDPSRLDAALADIDLVLHAAGPFAHTALPMARACLRTGTHYLDLAGEAPPIEALARLDSDARAAGIMLLPGIGFDVVPSDGLVAHVARRLPTATKLEIGIDAVGFLTPGSAKAFLEYAGAPVRVRRNGVLACVPPGVLEREFDYGHGVCVSAAMSWGDTVTAYYTTGIPDVTTYFLATPPLRAALAACRMFGGSLSSSLSQASLKAFADLLPAGPTPEQRASRRTVIVVEATDGRGGRAISRIFGPESYTFTALTAPLIAERALAGDLEIGFQTPARVYGSDFALAFEGVRREDVQ